MSFGSSIDEINSIPATDVRGITELNGTIVIATFGAGLAYWDRGDNAFRPIENTGGTNPFITHLAAVQPRQLLAGSAEGISVLSIGGLERRLHTTKRQRFPKIGYVTDIAVYSDGLAIIASNKGLFQYSSDDENLEEIILENDIPTDNLNSIEVMSNGKLVLGTDDGKILILDDLKNSFGAISKEIWIDNSSITDLATKNETIWVGTSSGLFYSSDLFKSFHKLTTKNSDLTNDHITNLCAGSNLTFVGTYQGLNIMWESPFELFNSKNSGVYDDVLAFQEDLESNIWVGTFDGLFVFDEETRSHHQINLDHSQSEIFDSRITALESYDDELWIGFRRHGIQNYSKNIASNSPNLPEGLEVTSLLKINAQELWISSYNSGVFRISQSATHKYLQPGSDVSVSVMRLVSTGDNVVLAITDSGLFRYNQAADNFIRIEIDFLGLNSSPLMLSINQHPSGSLWIGTKDHGLFIVEDIEALISSKDVPKLSPIEGIKSKTIYSIEYDESGNAWSSTENGIINLSRTGKLLDEYTAADGLQGQDFNFGASYRDSDGNIYFGGTQGYNRFNPLHIHPSNNVSNLSINSVTVYDASSSQRTNLKTDSRLTISHLDYLVSFSFSVLDFLDPENNQYRYKLEGFDPEWIDNGTRNTATYTNLPPGDYVLRVQGANSAGVWNREGVSLDLRVLPPPWLSWLAFCIYILMFAAFCWITHRVYASYMLKRKTLHLEEEIQRTRDSADDELQELMGMQDQLIRSTHHRNQSTLQLVSVYDHLSTELAPSEGHDEAATSSISRPLVALGIVEECVYFEGGEVQIDLHRYTDLLISRLLPSAPVPPESIISVNQVSTSLVPEPLGSHVAILIYELVQNTFTYAFGPESPANYLEVSFQLTQPSHDQSAVYLLQVQDSGPGVPEDVYSQRHNTRGMLVVKAISDELGAKMSVTMDSGTAFSFEIPDPQCL